MGTRKNVPCSEVRAGRRMRTRTRLVPLLVIAIVWTTAGGDELTLPSGDSVGAPAGDLFPRYGEPSGRWISLSYDDPMYALNNLPERSLEESAAELPIEGTATTNESLFPTTHGEGLHGGSLVGVVYDAKSGDPLSGVGILISEASLQSLSNDIGEFVIKGLEPKPYKVTFVQQGYEITSVQIEIGPGLPTRHKQPLEPKALDGDVFEMEGLDVIEEFEEESAVADRQFALREMTAHRQLDRCGGILVPQYRGCRRRGEERVGSEYCRRQICRHPRSRRPLLCHHLEWRDHSEFRPFAQGGAARPLPDRSHRGADHLQDLHTRHVR